VRQWVAAGAPAGKPTTVAATAPTTAHTSDPLVVSNRPARPFVTRGIEWIGKLHPLAAHTPIAVLMAAAIAEMLFLRYPQPALTGAARFCMVLGAMGAIATAILGWAMATTYSGPERELLEQHRWAGTAAAIACIPIALLGEWGARGALRHGRQWHGASRWVFRLSVFAIAGFVGFTAHIGGLIHWGTEFFAFPSR